MAVGIDMETKLYAYAHDRARVSSFAAGSGVAQPNWCAMLYRHMAPIPVLAPLFAHQFGWDEILMFAVPIVLALVGVRYAESRAAKRQAAQQTPDGEQSGESASSAEAAQAGGDNSGEL